ncbi:MAG: preprotein translocase subunit YajC [Planctomycetes bacterium]|nr:preprotein translocase subunit YajC [Planctomycetota bacterium]
MKLRRNLLLSIAAVALFSGICLGQAATQPSDKPQFVSTPSEQTGQPAQPGQQPAQPTAQQKPGTPQNQNPSPCGMMGGGDNSMMLIFLMIGVLVLVMVFSSRSRKKQEKKYKDMLASLKKGDRVVTIGGIIGTAVEVREDEVLIKIDENARIRILRRAISQVGEDAKKEADKKLQDSK